MNEGRRGAKRKGVPKWVDDVNVLRNMFTKVFPKLRTNEKQRLQAGRYARVFYLYFKEGVPASAIAEDLQLNVKNIERMINRLRRWGNGLNGHGQARLNPRGRPKNGVGNSPSIED